MRTSETTIYKDGVLYVVKDDAHHVRVEFVRFGRKKGERAGGIQFRHAAARQDAAAGEERHEVLINKRDEVYQP